VSISIIAPNFFPVLCGVGDHTAFFSEKLVQVGYSVNIFTCAEKAKTTNPKILITFLGNKPGYLFFYNILRSSNKKENIIIQYVPNLYGRFGVSFPIIFFSIACFFKRISLNIIFHEVVFGDGFQKPKYFALAVLQTIQAFIIGHISTKKFVSTSEGRIFLNKLGVNATLLPSPTNFNIEYYNTEKDISDSINIISFGYSDYRNNLLNEIAALVNANYANVYWHIVGINSFPETIFGERVSYHGYLENKRVEFLLKNADILFHQEGNSRQNSGGISSKSGIVATGLAAGLAVVGNKGVLTDPDIFIHGSNCYLVNNTVDEWYEGICFLIENELCRKKIAKAGKRTYETIFSWDMLIKKFTFLPN